MWHVVARDAWVLLGTVHAVFPTLPEALGFCETLCAVREPGSPFRRYGKPFVAFRRGRAAQPGVSIS